MNKFIFAVVSLLIVACGAGGGTQGGTGFTAMQSAHAAPDVSDILLGGVVDQSQIWRTSVDTYWREIGSGPSGDGNNGNYVGADGTFHSIDAGTWRVSKTVTAAGRVDLMAMPHVRSGSGGCHSRLYNKVRIVRVLPTRSENLALNSEALIEMYSGCMRFFDASRTVFATDFAPVVGQQNVYAVEVVAGDGTHTEISFGSPFRILNP